jgi:hypothetical protein
MFIAFGFICFSLLVVCFFVGFGSCGRDNGVRSWACFGLTYPKNETADFSSVLSKN